MLKEYAVLRTPLGEEKGDDFLGTAQPGRMNNPHAHIRSLLQREAS